MVGAETVAGVFFQAEDGIRCLLRSRGLGDVYKRQHYNCMVPGYANGVVNTLRLWSAQASHAFDLGIFNSGNYVDAVRAQTFAENISKVLYPEARTCLLYTSDAADERTRVALGGRRILTRKTAITKPQNTSAL